MSFYNKQMRYTTIRKGSPEGVPHTCSGCTWVSRLLGLAHPWRFGCWLWRKELPAEPAAPSHIERDVLNKRPSKEQDTKIEIHSSTRKSNLCWRLCQALLTALHTCRERSIPSGKMQYISSLLPALAVMMVMLSSPTEV